MTTPTTPKRPYYEPPAQKPKTVPVFALTAIVATTKGTVKVVTELIEIKRTGNRGL